MVVSLYLLFEILAVIFCLHYLYGEKVRFDIAAIVLVAIDLSWMSMLYWLKWEHGFSVLIYPIIMLYSGFRFGFDIRKIIVNNILCVLLITVLQAAISVVLHLALGIQTMEDIELLAINFVLCIIMMSGIKWCNLHKVAALLQMSEKLIIASFLTIVINIACFIIISKQDGRMELTYFYIVFISIVVIIMAMVDVGRRKVKMKEFQAELKLHKLYEKSFQNLIDDIRAKQHEFDNHINTIYSQHFLYKTYDELVNAQKTYCKNVTEENRFNKILSQGNKTVLAFLYGKLTEAEKSGVKVNYKVNIGELESKLPVHKVIELLGSLLDNAIEALKGEEKLTGLELIVLENQSEIMIRVSNECGELHYSDIQNFFKKGYSGKGRDRGYGLYNVKKICDEYGVKIEANLDEQEEKRWIHFTLIINKSL